MFLLILPLLWLPHYMGSPVDNTKSYGYAPYVWINVDTCNGGWCQGISASGFALAMGEYE